MVCVNGSWFHDLSAAVKYGREGAKKKQRQEDKRAVRELRDNDYQHQLGLTQRAFNDLVRLLDDGKSCISEGEKPCNSYRWDAGHFVTRGASSFLRFNFLNCYRQCASCNGGEEKFRANAKTVRRRYEENLVKRMGQEVVDWLKRNQHQTRKFTIDELKQMRAMYRAEIRYIEKYGKPSRDWRKFPPLEQAA